MLDWEAGRKWSKPVYDDQKHVANVSVRNHLVVAHLPTGPNWWNIYAYIFETSALFKEVLYVDSFFDLPKELYAQFHKGPTSLQRRYDSDGKCTCIKIGGDYNHLHDDPHTHCTDPSYYLQDAEILIEYIKQAGAAV